MAPALRLESRALRPALAALLSAALHAALLFVFADSGGRFDGVHESAALSTRLVVIERRSAERARDSDIPSLLPAAAAIDPPAAVQAQQPEPPSLFLDDLQREEPGTTHAAVEGAPVALEAPAAPMMSEAEQSTWLQQVALAAEALGDAAEARMTWSQNAKQYRAVLSVQRARDDTALDRVIAEVSAEHHGRQVFTRIKLKRMAFSNYAQLVDRWDPTVQLHDDEVDGRMHINSRFNLMHDRTAPKLLGKVTTAARSFHAESRSSRRQHEIFRGGIETRAGRIALPQRLQPFAWTSPGADARIHECAHDTRILFFADGSYTWRDLDQQTWAYRSGAREQTVYFIAARGAKLYVKGVVAGNVLVYSPERIIVEGSLTYAHDPRAAPGSHDYLGLVSDQYIQIAAPHVTGRGDLDLHAALFARRGFIVTAIDHPRSGTLRIFGSLTAGTLSATEPRYATKLEYDRRFEQRRPPGFPATSRFAVEEWDRRWTATSPSAAGALATTVEGE